MSTATRRISRRRGDSFLTHGGDNYDHKGLNRARREEGKEICREWDNETEIESMLKPVEQVSFRLVVQSQVFENYGDETNARWKPKGGEEYQQPIGTANDVIQLGSEGIQRLAKEIASAIEKNDDYYHEYMIGWSVVPNNEETCGETELREMTEYGIIARDRYEMRLKALQKPVLN